MMVISLSGCSLFDNTTTKSTTTTALTIDRSSIENEIYSQIYEKAKQDLYNDLYNALLEKYGSGTITWETLQEQVYQVVQESKGNIGITNYQTNEGETVAYATGSGVIFEKSKNADGTNRYYFITNEHVVESGVKFTADFSDSTSIQATLVGADKTTDIACLYFDTDRVFKVVNLGDSDEVQVGEFVVAVGNPKGASLYGSATFGIIGGTGRHLIENGATNTITSYLQHDAAINAGNSGGGLYNLKGECIGINSVKYVSSEIEGLNFAIPINLVKEVVDQLRKYGSYNGKVSLGITVTSVKDLTNTGRTTYEVPSTITSGVLITSVTEGSSSSGLLLSKDIIYKINDTDILTTSDISTILDGCIIGDVVKIYVYRAGVSTEVDVTFKRTTSS